MLKRESPGERRHHRCLWRTRQDSNCWRGCRYAGLVRYRLVNIETNSHCQRQQCRYGLVVTPDGKGFYYVEDDVNTLMEASL
jgi:hypothetical protein